MIGSILDTIYESDYFGLILMVAIIFLVILFLIVLFMGRKDKKQREVEATKKLEQINENAFKEESVAQEVAVPVSEPVLNNVNVENSEVINNTPIIEENKMPEVNNEPVLEPVNMNSEVEMIDSVPLEPVGQNAIVEPVIETSIPEVNITAPTPAIEEPVVSIPEVEPMPADVPPVDVPPVDVEINPINTYTTPEIKSDPEIKNDEVVVNIPEINIPEVEIPVVDIPKLEDVREEEKSAPVLEPISVPDFNFDSVVEEATNIEEEPKVEVKPAPQIFSSVYVPKQEVKEEVVEPVIEKPIVEDIHEDIEEDEFELPTLKKDAVKENEDQVVPIFEDYDLDSLSGETYNINK